MASSRNDAAILDAARECVLAIGLRRATLTEVARRAGVSRPTVYRRWPDMRALTADLLTRELRALLPDPGERPHNTREYGVDGIVDTLATVREHPLLVKILETDPELLTTYTFDRLGTSQREILDVFETVLRRGQRDGSVAEGDPAEMAATILLVVQSAALSWRVVSDRLPASRLDEHLRTMLDGYLRPRPGTSSSGGT
ncbi:TetR/AcrR family transcriptional regulator [Actinopolyspora mortivallis]|uniref:TetR family transcriptional regulator n=1 Tax=Actinopolyspora mortivallis TaxID=33906 RepID=A0A2T0GS87_ACTMO|nr:TetR/AcrR family transcriptional regulator [Actinopolyspora mortivallis]PRW61969.1 TetR family transcriptional regulator [Actinopolyspora mortivallis]